MGAQNKRDSKVRRKQNHRKAQAKQPWDKYSGMARLFAMNAFITSKYDPGRYARGCAR